MLQNVNATIFSERNLFLVLLVSLIRHEEFITSVVFNIIFFSITNSAGLRVNSYRLVELDSAMKNLDYKGLVLCYVCEFVPNT